MTQTIDISALLAPLDGERPHGEDVREHPEHSLTYFGIKDARNKARELERRAAFDDEETQTEPADWSPILRGVPELLKGQTKDLELAAWLLEALVRKHGFAGMRDGLHLACGLVQQYWPDVYPAEDEDGIRTKVNPLLGLNGNGATGALVGPILEIALTEDPGYSTNDYKLAQELENDDPEVRERRIAQGAASLLDIESRVKETSVEFFQELCGEIDASIAALGQLTDELNTRCGNDDGGYPIVGTFRNIAEAIETVRGALMAVAGHYLEPEAPAEEAAEDAGGDGSPSATGPIGDRQQALANLLRVADYFRRAEPHSPISYVLEQAVRWAKLPLPDLMGELIQDRNTLGDLFRLVGIRDNQEGDSSQ